MTGATLAASQRAVEQGEVDRVYYLTGEEDLLKDEFVELLIDRTVDPGTRDFNLDIRSAGDLDAESLNALVETPPMLAERRLAVVRNIEQWRKNSKPWKTLYQYLGRPSPSTTLVLIHGAGQPADPKLTKHATHIEVDVGDGSEVLAWVRGRAERAGIELEPDAMTHLVAASGGSLSRMASEIEKLAAAASGDGPMSADTVGRFIGVHRGETQSDWIAAALQRNVPRAVELLDVILEQSGVTPVRMLMALGTSLLGVRLARALLDDGLTPSVARSALFKSIQAARPPGLGRYGDEVAGWIRAAEGWTGAELDQALADVYTADQHLKASTLSDSRGTLRSMLLTFGTPGNPS